MGQVKIVTDTTCDLPQDIVKQYDIRLVPTIVTIGEKVYKDTLELSAQQLYETLKTSSERPVVAPPGRKDFSDVYTKLAQETDTVISIHISDHLGQTYNLATNMARFATGAAKKQGNNLDITVVNSLTTSIGLGIIVVEAARLAEAGKGKDEILANLTPIINNMKSLFMVDDISYLEKSGRIGKAGAVIGNFLKLKPIFSIEGGETSSKGFPMGGGNAVDKMIELMGEAVPFGNSIKLGMAHAMSPDKIEAVKPKILGNYNCVEIYETTIGSTVGSVMGPGSFGYVYFAT
jgi:DegV family protein with EDD domain